MQQLIKNDNQFEQQIQEFKYFYIGRKMRKQIQNSFIKIIKKRRDKEKTALKNDLQKYHQISNNDCREIDNIKPNFESLLFSNDQRNIDESFEDSNRDLNDLQFELQNNKLGMFDKITVQNSVDYYYMMEQNLKQQNNIPIEFNVD